MAQPARNASDLKRRVKRFLDKEREEDALLARLLDYLSQHTSVYLFGGVLRDIALYGISELNTDIDLVCEDSLHDIELSNEGIEVIRTKLGGFRTKTDHWMVDFWAVGDTWAFRNNIIEYQCIDSLLNTTITNWESILYGVADRRLLFREDYFRDINDLYLDIVLEANPNPLGMIVRIIRAYAYKDASELSIKAASRIEQALDQYTFRELSSYEKSHFNQGYIDQFLYDDLKSNRLIRERDMLPVVLNKAERQASLF